LQVRIADKDFSVGKLDLYVSIINSSK